MAAHRARARAGAVAAIGAVFEDMAEKVEVLAHGFGPDSGKLPIIADAQP